jgi:hypothetical protein
MAPIKFEEHIKDKLEKRTLAPSAEGWSTLSNRLDADHKTSKNAIFWWLSIAASIIIMVAVSVSFFNKGEAEHVLPAVVEDNVLEHKKRDNIKAIQLSLEIEDTKAYSNKNESAPATNKSQIIDYKKGTKKSPKTETILVKNKGENIKNNSPGKVEELSKELIVAPMELIIKNAVADALVEFKSETSTSVTDQEIDSLLKLATKERFKNKLKKEVSKTVDANILLKSVEEDMGQSFRTKVFHALKNGYETVKTAVVDRNN